MKVKVKVSCRTEVKTNIIFNSKRREKSFIRIFIKTKIKIKHSKEQKIIFQHTSRKAEELRLNAFHKNKRRNQDLNSVI
jgi:hypothetical protein